MKKKKIFIICPVRNVDKETEGILKDYVRKLEEEGHQVHYPSRDTDQNDPIGIRICTCNREKIYEANEVHPWFLKESEGSFFDLGMYFLFLKFKPEKKIVVINKDEVESIPYLDSQEAIQEREALCKARTVKFHFSKEKKNLFKLGMYFALLKLMPEKRLVVTNKDQIKCTPHKSFENVILELIKR